VSRTTSIQVDAVQAMRVGLSESAYRSGFQTAPKLLWLNAEVVSVGGKGTLKCQVGTRKMNASEPLMRRRKDKAMSKPRSSIVLGTSNKATCLLLLRHTAYRGHESGTGVCTERENLSLRCQEKTSSKRHYKRESIEAQHGGRTSRSSDEVPVMGMERRGCIIEAPSKRKLNANSGGTN